MGAAIVGGIALGTAIGIAVDPLLGIGLGLAVFAALAAGAGISGGRRP